MTDENGKIKGRLGGEGGGEIRRGGEIRWWVYAAGGVSSRCALRNDYHPIQRKQWDYTLGKDRREESRSTTERESKEKRINRKTIFSRLKRFFQTESRPFSLGILFGQELRLSFRCIWR